MRSLLTILSAINASSIGVGSWTLIGVVAGNGGGVWGDAAAVTGGLAMVGMVFFDVATLVFQFLCTPYAFF